ncbi:hypothetical protein PMEGAPR236_42740 [Priestia megaterium]
MQNVISLFIWDIEEVIQKSVPNGLIFVLFIDIFLLEKSTFMGVDKKYLQLYNSINQLNS